MMYKVPDRHPFSLVLAYSEMIKICLPGENRVKVRQVKSIIFEKLYNNNNKNNLNLIIA